MDCRCHTGRGGTTTGCGCWSPGTGRLLMMDQCWRNEAVAEVPGFARGLALAGGYAFVGLSKIRETSAVDGVPLAARRHELKCGVAVVDLRAGQVTASLEFQTAVEEIFDVQLLTGLRFPDVIGFQQDTIHLTFVVPPGESGSITTIGDFFAPACCPAWAGRSESPPVRRSTCG